MAEFAILGGLPGSGKTTLARRLRAERGFFVISSDQLRLALNAGVYPREGGGEYSLLDPVVWELVHLAARRLLEAGRNVAIDATNLTRARRAAWREFARSVVPGIRVTIHWCTGKYDSPERWASERGHTVEEYQAIRQALERQVEAPTAEEADEVQFHGPAPS